MLEPRILQVRTQILKKNDELARTMRGQFLDAGVWWSISCPVPGQARRDCSKRRSRILCGKVTALRPSWVI